MFILLALILHAAHCYGQQDTLIATLPNITAVPLKFIKQTNDKIDKYSNRITSKTEKTLTKLAKWENKIKNLLQKADPQTAETLFGNGSMSFTVMLQKVKEGKTLIDNYKAPYDAYSDKLTTSIKYIDEQKSQLKTSYIKPIKEAKANIQKLDSTTTQAEAITKLIKERKQQLINASIKILGKSKYLRKINEESYYYVETLRNYKELFHNKKKAEETAINILYKIPAFEKFASENSMLASLFGRPSNYGTAQSLAGLQTRASVNTLIQNRIAAGGPNAAAQISANMQAAQAELTKLKDKVLKAGAGNTDTDIPNFKPNTQKTKTFAQRIEYNTNFNIAKPSVLQPNTADIALGIGYKLNDKSIIGIAASYKMGFGAISNLKFSSEGVGLRSFIDWKLKKNFFVSGGFEMNYNTGFKNFSTLQTFDAWQQSGLFGLSKKLKVKTKLFKETKFQLLYDMLHKTHTPVTQPVIFRVGYNF